MYPRNAVRIATHNCLFGCWLVQEAKRSAQKSLMELEHRQMNARLYRTWFPLRLLGGLDAHLALKFWSTADLLFHKGVQSIFYDICFRE
jgi:hypothetical protein